ncbi:MAG: transcriptional repressor [Candidatus Pacebacteria bacterium]|nr:transcriptional repressor [Candidatus Paceibacterota bacterium]
MKKHPLKERLTSQKKIIMDYLKSTKSHPSAEKVYLEAKKKLPQISKGTVYRILSSFKDKEDVLEIPVNGVAYFDADISFHSHFICIKCGRIFDIFDACSKCKTIKNKKIKFGKIKNYKIYFYGICKFCK